MDIRSRVFYATVDGTRVKKFTKSRSVFMNSTLTAFNQYAKGRGFLLPVQGDYVGGLAWRNTNGQTMKLEKE